MSKDQMVYNHKEDDYCLAVGMTIDEQLDVAGKLAKITKGFAEDCFTVSQVTELVDKSLSIKEKTFVVSMYVKLVAKLAPTGRI